MGFRKLFLKFAKEQKSERISFAPDFTNPDAIRIFCKKGEKNCAVPLTDNLKLLLMQSNLNMEENCRYLFIDYLDIYSLYYDEENNFIEDYRILNLPEIFNGFIYISTEGNYLENSTVTYSFALKDGWDHMIRRVHKNIVIVDKEYRLLSWEMYECLQQIINYNTNTAKKNDVVAQFELLGIIKDYAQKANLALHKRLSIESKPVIIKKIKLDFDQNDRGTEIKPRVEGKSDIFNRNFLSAFDKYSDIRNFYNVNDSETGKDVKVIFKNRAAAQKLKRNRFLNGEKEREFYRGTNELFEDDSFDLSAYGERVKGFGYLHYRANVSINRNNNNWFDFLNEYEFPTIYTDEKKIQMYPEDIEYLQNKLATTENSESKTTEVEIKREEEVSRLILSADELRSEIANIKASIVEPEKIKNQKVLMEIQTKIEAQPEKPYFEFQGCYVKNCGKEQINKYINQLREDSDKKGTEAQKSLIAESNIDKLGYEEKNTTTKIKEFPLELPATLQAKLFEHQEEGVHRLQSLFQACQQNGFLLADDMGLGKTIQILTFLAWLKEKNQLSPSLIVAPTTLLDNWDNNLINQPGEIQRFFAPNTFKTFHIQGRITKNEQDIFIQNINNSDLIFTTYDSLRLNHIWLGTIPWKCLVCDEVQAVKNPRTLNSNALKAQNVQYKIACSATPIENSTEDLWNIMDIAVPGLLGSLQEFKKNYVKPLRNLESYQIEERRKINDKLVNIIGYHFLRRNKEDKLKELPAKKVIVNYVSINEQEKQRIKELNQLRVQGENPLTLIQKLLALCSHPRLLQGLNFNISKNNIDKLIGESTKLLNLKLILEPIAAKKEKAVIFTPFRSMQNLLVEALHYWFNIDAKIINGKLSPQKRTHFLYKFRQSFGFDIIILSPLAAGTGITITEANHVIHYTRLWNPAREAQATDRVYRIGQEKEVYVYYPITTFNDNRQIMFSSEKEYVDYYIRQSNGEQSPEEKLNKLLVRKKKILNNFFLAAGDIESDIIKEWEDEKTDSNPISMTVLDTVMNSDEIAATCSLLFKKMGYQTYLTINNIYNSNYIFLEKEGKYSIAQFVSVIENISSYSENLSAIRKLYNDILPRTVSSYVLISTDYIDDDSNKLEGKFKDTTLLLRPQLTKLLMQHKIYQYEVAQEKKNKFSLERIKQVLT